MEITKRKKKLLDFLLYYRYKFSPHFNKEYKELFNGINPQEMIIFDVGAHKGESVRKFKKLFPSSKIHTFEPDKDSFKELVKEFASDKNVFLNNFAFGSCNDKKKFNKCVIPGTSSFRKFDKDSRWVKSRCKLLHVEPDNFILETSDVNIRKIDDYVKENSIEKINILKLDVEGYEDECLKGCTKTLKRNLIDAVQTELIMGDFYEEKKSFKDIEKLICPFNYTLYRTKKHSRFFTAGFTVFDLLFIRKSFIK